MTEAFVYDAVRTPRGRGKDTGSLHGTKPVSLVVGPARRAAQAQPGPRPGQRRGRHPRLRLPGRRAGRRHRPHRRARRRATRRPGPGFQLNRFCASGLEAVNIAAQKVRSGWEDLIFAGGVESMSRVPMGSDGGAVGAWTRRPRTRPASSRRASAPT